MLASRSLPASSRAATFRALFCHIVRGTWHTTRNYLGKASKEPASFRFFRVHTNYVRRRSLWCVTLLSFYLRHARIFNNSQLQLWPGVRTDLYDNERGFLTLYFQGILFFSAKRAYVIVKKKGTTVIIFNMEPVWALLGYLLNNRRNKVEVIVQLEPACVRACILSIFSSSECPQIKEQATPMN